MQMIANEIWTDAIGMTYIKKKEGYDSFIYHVTIIITSLCFRDLLLDIFVYCLYTIDNLTVDNINNKIFSILNYITTIITSYSYLQQLYILFSYY